MTVEEIFTKISHHMLEGLMFHSDMVDYYEFLTLPGYSTCHYYHLMDESCNYRKLQKFYIHTYDKLIPETEVRPADLIPESWYSHTRQDVDTNTVRNSVKSGLMKWEDWEHETRKMYEQMYQELEEIGEIKACMFLKNYICDVDHEWKKVKKYHLRKKLIDYSISDIMAEQKHMKEKYECKIRSMKYND